MSDIFEKRGAALEEVFYQKKNADLLEKLRAKQFGQVTKEDIRAATGIHDEDLLDRLVGMKITVQSLAALSVIPLVEVAWADGELDDRERKAVLKAADEAGIPHDGPGYKLLQEWLADKPPAQLLSAWKDYIEAMAETLQPEDYAKVRDNLLTRAKQVAQSAGGFLGIGKISDAEQRKLDDLEATFVRSY
jgi:hypothetical protein